MITIDLESPEHLILSARLAGPGPRIVALVVDLIIQTAAVVVVFLVATGGSLNPGDREFQNFALTFFYIVVFLIQWGYFTVSEITTLGQSPGKRIVGIRTVRGDGQPLDASTIILRNLLRVVDSFPVLYLVGGLVSILDKQHRRIGDLVAGTIVIHDPKVPTREPIGEVERSREVSVEVPLGASRLSEEELYAVRRFLASYAKLPETRQMELAGRLADRVARRLQIPLSSADPIAYLEGVYSGHTAEDRE